MKSSGSGFVLALSIAAVSCKTLAPGGPAAGQHSDAHGPASARVQIKNLEDRPPLVLVHRLGDPFAAAALVAAHDAGSEASVALAALVEARLSSRGFAAARARAHGLGFEVASLVQSAEQAARFVSAASAALRAPVTPGDPALAAIAERLAKLRAHSLVASAQAAVAACSGELGIVAGAKAWAPTTAAGAERIEQWRRLVDSSRAVAFAALGSPEVLDAATKALDETPDWPAKSEPNDPWPARDIVGADAVTDGRRQLSLALRVGSAPAALEAAQKLGRRESTLALRLRANPPPWTLDRVVYTARPRGACLRIDVVAPAGDPAPTTAEVARIALLAFEEADVALAATPDAASLDEAVLRPADPREAASVAAWRALSARHEAGPTRKLVSFETQPGESGTTASVDLLRAMEQQAALWKARTIEQRARIEPGQSEVWALLASPCGTGSETRHDAGLGALVVRTLAAKSERIGDVELEAWVHPDGLGLLAHAARRTPTEPPQAQAERVGAALGRALASTRLGGTDVAVARARLLDDLGPAPRPGFWLAVDSSVPGHPSWLEPRGTWSAISDATVHSAEARRLALVRGPLRLAVVANSDPTQADAALRGVERWLRPLRSAGERCPGAKPAPPQTGELKLETAGEPPSAYVAVPIAPGGASPGPAEWTLLLLNRPGGWLDRAVRLPGVAAARAHLLGGSRARAFVVEVSPLDAEPRAAVAQVRALFERLAAGAATQQDVEIASTSFARLATERALEPRRRVVDLWHGTLRAPQPNLAELRAFHKALRADHHVVVLVESR